MLEQRRKAYMDVSHVDIAGANIYSVAERRAQDHYNIILNVADSESTYICAVKAIPYRRVNKLVNNSIKV